MSSLHSYFLDAILKKTRWLGALPGFPGLLFLLQNVLPSHVKKKLNTNLKLLGQHLVAKIGQLLHLVGK